MTFARTTRRALIRAEAVASYRYFFARAFVFFAGFFFVLFLAAFLAAFLAPFFFAAAFFVFAGFFLPRALRAAGFFAAVCRSFG